jgi:hypothetical protein
MTLPTAVVDLRTKFWEHGQLSVALSRVRSPADLCILLPDDLTDLTIDPRMDPEVVHMVRSLDNDNTDGPMDDFHSEADGPMDDSDDMPSLLEGPSVPEGDDEVSDGHEEHREEEGFEPFDPFPMPTAPTPELARDLEWQTNLPREDMFDKWDGVPFVTLLRGGLNRSAREWNELPARSQSALSRRCRVAAWIETTRIRVIRLLAAYRLGSITAVAQGDWAPHEARAVISPEG